MVSKASALIIVITLPLILVGCSKSMDAAKSPDGGNGPDPEPLCTEGYCDENATCNVVDAALVCTCNEGWEGDGFTCEDVDECAEGIDECDEEQGICINLPGTYECQCEQGFWLSCDGMTCLDDEAAMHITASKLSACYLKKSGEAVCHGENQWGELDLPSTHYLHLDLNNRACGVLMDETVECWGIDPEPEIVEVPSGQFTTVTTSSNGNACGIHPDGSIECWGCGDCMYGLQELFAHTPDGEFEEVFLSGCMACGKKTDGSLECWTIYNTPQDYYPTDLFLEVTTIDTDSSWCGIKMDGSVSCWWGEGSIQTPVGLTGSFKTIDVHGIDIPYSSSQSELTWGCGIREDLTLDCHYASYSGPWDGPPSGKFCEIATGTYYTCGIKTDGTVECFGPSVENHQFNPPW